MGSKIKLESPTIVDEEEVQQTVCPLCLKNVSRYTCPRCNIKYCSLACYKSEKHMNCSESFYRDCFMDGLKEGGDIEPEERSKVLEMLQRVEEQGQDGVNLDEEEEGEDIHERLNNLDLDKDTAKIWEKLTVKEQKEFESMMYDGRLGNLIEIWTPWWVSKETVLVSEIDEQRPASNSRPRAREDVPHISSLLPKSKPSAVLKYVVLNVLYAYAFVCRLHNGDHLKQAVDSTRDLLKVSAVMADGQTFESTRETIQACISAIGQTKAGFDTTRQFNISVIQDIIILIQGPDKNDPLRFLLLAFSDLSDMLTKANKVLRKQMKHVKADSTPQELSVLKKKLFKCSKQAEFHLSWIQTYGLALKCLVLELEMEYSVLTSELEEVKKTSKEFELEWGGKVKQQRKLIQEID